MRVKHAVVLLMLFSPLTWAGNMTFQFRNPNFGWITLRRLFNRKFWAACWPILIPGNQDVWWPTILLSISLIATDSSSSTSRTEKREEPRPSKCQVYKLSQPIFKLQSLKDINHAALTYFGCRFIVERMLNCPAETSCETDINAPRTKLQRFDALTCSHR